MIYSDCLAVLKPGNQILDALLFLYGGFQFLFL